MNWKIGDRFKFGDQSGVILSLDALSIMAEVKLDAGHKLKLNTSYLAPLDSPHAKIGPARDKMLRSRSTR